MTFERVNMKISRIFIICNAYESGYGHGTQLDGLPNPYTEGSEEHEAYSIGYESGEAQVCGPAGTHGAKPGV